jgi:hypothetical protein
VHEYLFLSLCWMAITNLCLFGLLYLLLYFFMHPIDSHHNTTFFLKLTGSNISLWCYFWIDFYLNIFRNTCLAVSSIVSISILASFCVWTKSLVCVKML